MKSFSQKTKEVMCRTEPGRLCCSMSEFFGILMFSGKYRHNEIKASSETSITIERFVMLLKKCFGYSAEIEANKNTFLCTVTDEKVLKKMHSYFFRYQDGEYILKNIKEIVKNECCRGAFLRGAFLGGGIIVDPNKNYNMEFTIASPERATEFNAFLTEINLDFKRAERKGKHVLYVKNSNVICDALAYMGAFGVQMEILNIKIEKELRNDVNRTVNGETANMDKVITAAIAQIRAIEKIEKTIGLDSLSDELCEIALLRKDNKDLSLEQLGKRLYPQLSKSGVNHRLKKIISIAENIDKK